MEIRNRSDYLLVKAEGLWCTEQAMEMIDQTKEAALEAGHRRILMDLSAWSKPLDEFTRFEFGVYLAEALPPPYRVAAHTDPRHINRFAENTAVNRGAQFRIFSSEEEALRWLLR